MSIYLFDNLSNLKKFVNTEKPVTIYLCGPTLYDQLHLGNLRPIITFDFIIRYLKTINTPYYYVQNLTDVDEKIIRKAFNEKKDVKELTSDYYRRFLKILEKLNIVLPNNFPSVSENISEIQRIIECLLSSGFAYWDKNTRTIKFSQIDQDKNLNYFYSSESQELEEADFALWKENRISTFNFDSPWFPGIPGWHIECLSMIQKYFQLPISIHGGGVDLKFPHHENENLICRSLFKKDLAECWVHVGQVLNSRGKLSKSSNLSYSIDKCASNYSWTFLRYIFMKTKYHRPITITSSLLNGYWKEWKGYLSALLYSDAILEHNWKEVILFETEKIVTPDSDFLKTLEEDLNLPKTISWLEDVKRNLLQALKEKQLKTILYLSKKLKYHLSWLGFEIKKLNSIQRKKTNLWISLIEQQKYTDADKIRTQLQEEGVLP